MKNFKMLNRIFAGLAFVISLFVYMRTIAPTVSFWDCGEFITCSYILGIPHPPGAPFYLLLGRIFTMLPLAADIGLRVNIISALSSALTVMLTYLITVRLIQQWRGKPREGENMIILIASGLLAALTFAFTDTFWFNAVEAEVYAISMLFTSLIVWLMLVWLEKAEDVGSERYLLLIAYLVGLAIAVHLLMVLVLPALFLIVYYKALEMRGESISLKNLAIFGGITAGIFWVIYPGVVQYVPRMAGAFGYWTLPALLLLVLAAIIYTVKTHQRIASVALMSLMLIMVGYSTYTMIYIRSNLDPAIDENDPENITNMVKYLNREQYGQWSTFPRRYPGLPSEYQFSHQYPNRDYATYNLGRQLDFMWNYQIKKMYLRYFAWQFIGKGETIGPDGFIVETFSGRGLFFLPFLLGLIGMIHHFYRHWRHALSIFGIFILTGVAIVIYLNQEDPQPRERDYVFVGSFFAFAIWIGMSLTALAEWIQEAVKSAPARKAALAGLIGFLFLISPVNLIAFNYDSHDRTGNYVAYDYSYNILQTCEPNAILFTNGDNDTFPLWFLQEVYGIRKDVRVVNLSLLNTPWYIKQLKEPGMNVPISLTQQQIEGLEPMQWQAQTIKIPVPKDSQQAFVDEFREEYGDTTEQAILDQLSLNIEPTIFGQAIRVQDYMILNILYANRWKNPVYFAVTVSNENKLNMDQFLRMDGLAFKMVPYEATKINADILSKNLFEVFKYRNLDDPEVHLPDNVVGLLQNYRAAFLRLSRDHWMQEEYDKMVNVLDKMEEILPEKVIPIPDIRLALSIGQMYQVAGRTDRYEARLRTLKEMYSDNAYVNLALIQLLSGANRHAEAIQMLEEWVAKNPNDSEAQRRLEQQRRLLAAEQRTDTTTQGTLETR
ncbi:DUF2723 domain-containing protein [candidate division KSB1 bacterium]|nr:DUF2723 domain-containing protein [candidate division KSB1 bacterium]